MKRLEEKLCMDDFFAGKTIHTQLFFQTLNERLRKTPLSVDLPLSSPSMLLVPPRDKMDVFIIRNT